MIDFTFAHRKEGFDNHINLSIRGYNDLLDDVVNFSRCFVENETNVVDIGCSTGKITERLINYNKDFCNGAYYIGIEIADGFSDVLDNRKKEINEKYPATHVEFIKDNVKFYKFTNCSLITSIFTLQFMSKKDRQQSIKNIYNGLNEGGAFIFSEKIDCKSSRIHDMMVFNYYDFKRKKFSADDILDKERMLRHMLKPNTWDEIKTMILSSGFQSIQIFWQNHIFIGVIAIK